MSSPALRYWVVSYHPARAFWLGRGLSLLLALDALLLMVAHAGRYGVGSFNVAHFAWLDEISPVASPAPYLTLLTASALLALCGVVRPLPRPAQALLLVTYTAAWALSQHDSYQHHYLISWLLAWMLWLPRSELAECRDVAARTSGAGLPMTALSCAIVYAFTAVSKSSSAWQGGAVLRQLARSPGPFSLLNRLDPLLGGEGRAFRLAALLVLATQVVIAAAYALAPLLDALQRAAPSAHRSWARVVRWLCGAGWLCSVGFHVTTELQASFSIGWFSYYMLWIGAIMFAPSAWLSALASSAGAVVPREPAGRRSCLLLLVLALVAALALIVSADLPGVREAVLCIGVGYLSVAFLRLTRGQVHVASDFALSISFSLCLTLGCLTIGHVRFDYCRRLAGELLRMERLEDALEQYRKAERYAPRGQTRSKVIQRIERTLSEQRGQRHRQL